MTGADIVGALLRADADLLALVPVSRIKAKRLPPGTALPALLVRVVSVVDRQPLTLGEFVRRTDRVAVTVRAGSGDDQDAIIELVRAICAGRTGAIAGAINVSIRTSGLGPDLNGPGDSFEQTQDLRVSFDAPLSQGDQP